MLKLATSSILLPEYRRKVLQFTAQRRLVKTTEPTSYGFKRRVLWFAKTTTMHTNTTQTAKRVRLGFVWSNENLCRGTADSTVTYFRILQLVLRCSSSHEAHGNPDAFSVPFIASASNIAVTAVSASVNTCNISEASGAAQGLPSAQIFILFPTAWHALATRKWQAGREENALRALCWILFKLTVR